MEVAMKMPDLATTGSPIKVVRWLVDVGHHIERGGALLEIETDKAVMVVESVVTGRLRSIAAGAAAGEEVSAGQTIAMFETERAAAPSDADPTVASIPEVPARLPSVVVESSGIPGRKSFFARNREARRRNRGLAVPLTVPQRVVARVTQESKQTIPHFYLQTSACAERIAARRTAAAGKTLAWDAFFVHAAGKALRKFDRFCHRFETDRLLPQDIDAVGLAIDLDDELFTLAIERPAAKTPEQISAEIEHGVARLRAGDPAARLSARANLTVTNLGGWGVESFAAVINPPESAILAVGKIMPVATIVEGQVALRKRVNLTLSADHRVVSGKYAARFLGAIVQELESL
jgi:pyruvate/2-oxoglutarate dehydrogenase complex dihydrolipoamide acyltransferase (E2) component